MCPHTLILDTQLSKYNHYRGTYDGKETFKQ